LSDLVRTDVPSDFDKQMRMAQVYAESSLLPAHLRGKPANVLIILAGARSLNVSAFWALQSMHVIEGKLSISAELMRGLAIRAGHKVKIIKRERDEAIVEIQRADSDTPYRASFSWQEAIDAELHTKSNWKKYPKAMLVARATSIAMRDECPDVLYGVIYTPDELGAVENEDGTIAEGAESAEEAEEVKPMEGQELAKFLADVASANPEQLINYARIGKERASLGIETGGGTVQSEMVARMKYLTDADGVTESDIRALYRFANGLSLLDTYVTVTKVPGAEQEIVTIRDALQMKIAMIQAEAARLAEPDIQDAEIVEPDEESKPEVNTEHAQKMREEAAASWSNEGER